MNPLNLTGVGDGHELRLGGGKIELVKSLYF